MQFNGIQTRAGMILPDRDGVERYPQLDPAYGISWSEP